MRPLLWEQRDLDYLCAKYCVRYRKYITFSSKNKLANCVYISAIIVHKFVEVGQKMKKLFIHLQAPLLLK